jgi:hypothetical protein
MPVQVQGPDGKTYQFPDGTDKTAAVAYFKKKGIGAAPVSTAKPKSFSESYDETVAPLVTQTPHNLKSLLPGKHGQFDAGAYAHEAGTALSNVGAAGLGVILHPVDTAVGIAKTAVRQLPPVALYEQLRKGTDVNQEMAQQFVKQPLETAETMAGQGAVLGAAAEGAGNFKGAMTKTLESMRKGVTGTGTEATRGLVEKTQAGNAAADAFSKVRSAIETAREKALKVGNEKYNGVNEKLNPIEADPLAVRNMTADARSVISDQRGKLPTLLKDFDDRVSGTSVTGMSNGPLTYDELQRWYSKFGSEISKGTLQGEEYHAYDQLHEAIGNEMQRIADSQGAGEQLTEARNYWRRMKQTFGKPLSQNDAATSTLRALSPEMAEQDTIANRVRLMGSFDPDIPQAFEQLRKTQEAAKGIPKPAPGETRKIGPEDVREAKTEALTNRAELVRKVGQRIARYGLGLKALWDGFHGNLESAGSDVVLGAAGYKAAGWIANALEKPSVVKLLTEPTEQDIAQIPPELRGEFPKIVAAAKAKGIKVDPRLAGLGGAFKGPNTQKLEQTREQQLTSQ